MVCPPPTAFLCLIHNPIASRLDNRCPWHQFLVPPQLPALVPARLPLDITEAVGIPAEHVDGEQCDVPDCLHAKDKQHKPMIRHISVPIDRMQCDYWSVSNINRMQCDHQLNYTLVSTCLHEDMPGDLPHTLLRVFEQDRSGQLHPTRSHFTKVVGFGHLDIALMAHAHLH